MSMRGNRLKTKARMRAERPKRRPWREWSIVVLILFGIWAVFFGLPAGIRYLKAPPISEDFGLEDAVVALRLYADDVSYLVLVDESGATRSVQLEERGFEESGLAWTDAGLSTGGPADEYLLHADGLTRMPLPGTNESSSERSRLATLGGFAVYNGSAQGQQLAFVDAASQSLTAIDLGYLSPAFTTCDDDLVLVDESGVRTVTPQTRDFEGLGLFSGAGTLICDQDRVYGLDEIVDEEDSAHQTLRTWDRATGEKSEVKIRYPEAVYSWEPGTPFVWEGRLHWAAGSTLWSIPLGEDLPQGSLEPEPVADVGGFLGDLSPVVGTGSGVLAAAGGRVFGVAEDSDFVNPRRGPSYDKLLDVAIFSVDVTTGERRIEITIDDIDFPKRDLNVEAIAVEPGWASAR